MAVPFNMPEGQTEVEILLLQLQTLINKLQVAVRRNQQQSLNTVANNSRVRSTSRVRSRDSPSTSNNNDNVPSSSPTFPDLLTHLSLMAGSSTDSSSSPLTGISVRPPRQRTLSSNTDETKISITAIVKHDFYAHDCNKIECLDPTTEPSTMSTSEGIFSKLTPASVSSCSLMTAMICFMGWHIFRAR